MSESAATGQVRVGGVLAYPRTASWDRVCADCGALIRKGDPYLWVNAFLARGVCLSHGVTS